MRSAVQPKSCIEGLTHIDHFGHISLAQIVYDTCFVQKGETCDIVDESKLSLLRKKEPIRRVLDV